MIETVLGNPLSKALAGICAGLLALNGLLALAWMLPVSGSAGNDDAFDAALGGDIPSLAPARPIDTYSEITERPLFNETREPIIYLAEDEGDEEGSEEEVVEAPEVELVGIVITPEMRIATLRDKKAKEPLSIIAVEGQPLEGDYGGWRVAGIEPRTAMLESSRGETVELELQMHDEVIKEPPEAKGQNGANSSAQNNATQAQPADPSAPLSRADQIRQRIAERREELQQAAEDGEDASQTQPDYRSNIQQLIQARQARSQNNDDSKQ